MEIDEYLNSAHLIGSNQNHRKYKIECQDGYGHMTSYQPIEGIWVIMNDFHSNISPESHMISLKNYLEINHCLKGRFECVFEENRYGYLGEGDLSISDWSIKKNIASFPLGYYYGIEIFIDIDIAKESPFFKQLDIDIERLFMKVRDHQKLYIVRSTQRVQHILWEMYHDFDLWQNDYLKLKVAEILFFFVHSSFDDQDSRHYYTKSQIENVKKVKAYLETHYSLKFTVQQLADLYHMNIGTLRKCFKDIYGKPIYQWHKEYRLQMAKQLLENTDLSILEIAAKVGYDNPSKFSSAFAKQYNQTPLLYRKIHQY